MTHQVKGSAGFVPGVPRLGIPDQTQTDASIGVRNSFIPSTALPSSLATAASFDPEVPRAGGAMIGAEARATGHNTMLSGGVNLAREPRNGRNFEYTGEDPLLAGTMAGALIDGIQSNRIISTIKHYAVNDQETQRTSLDVTISAEAMRQSDLLAFELAIEKGKPGSVMCSYNLINGRWGCENDYLLNTVLKHDWGFKGFVMSDWGAVHSTADAANDGLDQFTGFCCVGDKPWFAPPAMKAALQSGAIPQARLDDMVERILWALFAKGAVDHPVKPAPIDYAANALVSQKAAEESLVLLKNDGDLLPLRGRQVDRGHRRQCRQGRDRRRRLVRRHAGRRRDHDRRAHLPALAAARRAQARAAARADRLRRRHRSGGRRRAGGEIRRRRRLRHAARQRGL